MGATLTKRQLKLLVGLLSKDLQRNRKSRVAPEPPRVCYCLRATRAMQ